MNTKVKKGIFWDLDWDHLESLCVAKDAQTQGTQWGGFMCALVTKTIMRDGGELGFIPLLFWVPPVAEECSSLWADEITLSKKIKYLSCFKQTPTSHLRIRAHKTPKTQETKLLLERGFSLSKLNSLDSCLLCVVSTSYSCSAGKKSHSVFWNHRLFPRGGLAFACHLPAIPLDTWRAEGANTGAGK